MSLETGLTHPNDDPISTRYVPGSVGIIVAPVNIYDMIAILEELRKGKTIYLQTQEPGYDLVKLVPVGDGITLFKAFVKLKGRDEFQSDTNTKLVVDAMLGDERVTQAQYDNL